MVPKFDVNQTVWFLGVNRTKIVRDSVASITITNTGEAYTLHNTTGSFPPEFLYGRWGDCLVDLLKDNVGEPLLSKLVNDVLDSTQLYNG